jgi:succinate dehydrogenase/fumarate reductase cytochrome b subunit
VQQELVREDIERMEQEIRNLCNIIHRVTGNSLTLFFLDIETAAKNSEIYHIEYLQNMRFQTELKAKYYTTMQAISGVLPYQGVLRTQTKMREMWHIT